jgi:hypothetical protein
VSSSSERPGRADSRAEAQVLYRERLATPMWWYLVALAVAAVLAGEFHVAGQHLTVWIPFGVLLPLSVAVVWAMGHSTLEVSGGEVRIRGAHLPLQYVSGCIGLDHATLRRVVGREGDPSAYVSIRPWIGGGVQLWLDDPDDPTPYWVVSTRHPDRLVAALRSAR